VPGKAKAYIAIVIVSGTLVLLVAAGSWSSTNLKQFAIYSSVHTENFRRRSINTMQHCYILIVWLVRPSVSAS
jgi:hypothetical protein